MKYLLLIGLFLPTFVFAQVTVVSEQPRYVTVYQKQCELKPVVVNNTTSSGIVGGIVGAAIGNQIGGGSGRDIATVVGAITGTSIGRARAEQRERVEYKNICHKVPVQVPAGKIVTFSYDGKIFTQVFEN